MLHNAEMNEVVFIGPKLTINPFVRVSDRHRRKQGAASVFLVRDFHFRKKNVAFGGEIGHRSDAVFCVGGVIPDERTVDPVFFGLLK